MKRLAFIGECMIELRNASDASGAFGTGGAMHRTFGGDTLNSAVYAARCLKGRDAAVDYVTILGDDPFSAEMLTAWRAEGVGTTFVGREPGALPGLYAIRTDALGERSFHYWRSAAPAEIICSKPWRMPERAAPPSPLTAITARFSGPTKTPRGARSAAARRSRLRLFSNPAPSWTRLSN